MPKFGRRGDETRPTTTGTGPVRFKYYCSHEQTTTTRTRKRFMSHAAIPAGLKAKIEMKTVLLSRIWVWTVRTLLLTHRGETGQEKNNTRPFCSLATSKRSRSVFVGQVAFWRPGVPRPKAAHFPECDVFWPCRHRRQKPTLFINLCGFWPWYPRPPKEHLANTNISESL